MIDFLIQATLSNLIVATALALVAWTVQRRVRSASLANLLWALVLIKLVTPPLWSIPLFEVPSASFLNHQVVAPTSISAASGSEPTSSALTAVVPVDEVFGIGVTETRPDSARFPNRLGGMVLIFGVWLTTSLLMLLVSVFRIFRFHSALKENSRLDHGLSHGSSRTAARQLGIANHPDVFVTSANIAPFVWWMSGRAVIVVSMRAVDGLSPKDLDLVITHEMAHIKRRDHWFRWLEWAVLVGFWWNPVMWWSRSGLRMSEEMACDDLVLETSSSGINQYANSLLNMAELLAAPATRPPVVATAINSGGSLEKRLTTMINKRNWKLPTTLRTAIMAFAFCIFPLGVVFAQDFEAVERRLGGAVEAGEISLHQAHLMLEALKRSSQSSEMESRKTQMEKVARELEFAVKTGKLSKTDARAKMDSMFAKTFERERDDLEGRKRKYAQIAREIEMAVKAEKMSKQDAEKKLMAVRKEMFQPSAEQRERTRRYDSSKQEYEKLARDIEAAVKAGKLKQEYAKKRLEELHSAQREQSESAKRRDDDEEMKARKEAYLEIAQEIEGAVKSGNLSKEAADKKLVEIRAKMFRSGAMKKRERAEESKKRDYEEAARQIEAAVKAGKVKKEDAKKRLDQMRKALNEQEKALIEQEKALRSKDRAAQLKYQFMDAQQKLEIAVKEGKITKEHAEERINQMRKAMIDQERSSRSDNREADLKRKYMQAARQLEEAVEAGRLTKELAEERLVKMRKEMGEREDSKDKD